jgi:predicted RNase H-related nuclease YkuK (DUF458 family)
MRFLTHEGKPIQIAKYLREYFKDKKGKLHEGLYKLWLGCDSAYRRHGWSEYVTVTCIRIKQNGVHVLHKRRRMEGKIKPNPELQDSVAKKNLIFNMVLERLWQEVLEIEILINHLKEEGILYYKNPEDEYLSAFTSAISEIAVHVDFNGHEEHLSNHLTSAAISYFAALGVKAEKKPDAFAATFSANWYLK